MEAPKKVKVARARKNISSKPGSAMNSDVSSAADSAPASTTVSFPADLRIGSAAKIHAELSGAVAEQPLIMDASAVTKVDAAGLQAILAALLKRPSSSTWVWSAPSEPFLRAVRALGLQDALALSAK